MDGSSYGKAFSQGFKILIGLAFAAGLCVAAGVALLVRILG